MITLLLKKYILLIPLVVVGNVILGMGAALIGPSIPYLSERVDQSLATIGFIITARSIGFCISSLGTSFIFYKLKKGSLKLLFLSGSGLLMGCSLVIVPLTRSYILLVVALTGFGVASGMYDTAVNSLLVYLFGPVHSRPLLQFLHCGVSLGGFIGPLISQPFLKQMGEIGNIAVFCSKASQFNNFTSLNSTNILQSVIVTNESNPIFQAFPAISWPYVIMMSCCGILSILLIVLSLTGIHLPKFSTHGMTFGCTDKKPTCNHKHNFIKKRDLRYRKTVLLLFFFFYWIMCGKENMYWSHLYSFAICSDLSMDESAAAFFSISFFLGFFLGRLSGIFISWFVRPKIILISELCLCLFWNIIMSVWGESNVYVAYITSVGFGFNISMVFGTGISWMASKTDITARASCINFIGAYLGISTMPALCGALFSTPVGAISMAYLSTALSIADILLLLIMMYLAKFKVYSRSKSLEVSLTTPRSSIQQ